MSRCPVTGMVGEMPDGHGEGGTPIDVGACEVLHDGGIDLTVIWGVDKRDIPIKNMPTGVDIESFISMIAHTVGLPSTCTGELSVRSHRSGERLAEHGTLANHGVEAGDRLYLVPARLELELYNLECGAMASLSGVSCELRVSDLKELIVLTRSRQLRIEHEVDESGLDPLPAIVLRNLSGAVLPDNVRLFEVGVDFKTSFGVEEASAHQACWELYARNDLAFTLVLVLLVVIVVVGVLWFSHDNIGDLLADELGPLGSLRPNLKGVK
eukprot:c20977_g1_i1.p1 GENE.c20977_g1_i1~~c20977_g1_i1.p1  ORF type:complete len:268 (+),score=37.25 c20977_g1_i1:44-847(+)